MPTIAPRFNPAKPFVPAPRIQENLVATANAEPCCGSPRALPPA